MDKLKEISRLRKKAHAKLIALDSKTYKKFVEMEEITHTDGEISNKYKEILNYPEKSINLNLKSSFFQEFSLNGFLRGLM